MRQKKTIDEVEKVLGEPVVLDLGDGARRVRNGLLITSVIAISMALGGFQISPDSSVLGLKFEGLNSALVIQILFAVNVYLFFHFLWFCFDSFHEWGVRVTGTRVVHVTTGKFASEAADYPNDPRQSSLYNWWNSEAKKIGAFAEPFNAIEEKLKNWEAELNSSLQEPKQNVINCCMSISRVSEDIRKLSKAIESSCEALESNRIPASLKRFDSRFELFLRSQNLRWLVMELGLPILIGAYSLAVLVRAL